MGTVVYYFSGTGNSLKTAKEISRKLDDSFLVPITKLWKQEKIVTKAKNIGFVFPLYYYGLPDIVYKFVQRLISDDSKFTFAVVTRAGSQGSALHQLNEILERKGKKLDMGFYLQMPNNYHPFGNIPNKNKQKKIIGKAHKKLKGIIRSIKMKKGKGDKDHLVIRGSAEHTNISWRKNVNSQDKNFHVTKDCHGCGFCEKICPVGNISLKEGHPVWFHKCQQCYACISYCPKDAIEFGKKSKGKIRYHHPEIHYREIANQR